MAHKFVILVDKQIKEYSNFDDIPLVFDNLIEFRPEYLPPPHTHEQHLENAQWEGKFEELLKRETK